MNRKKRTIALNGPKRSVEPVDSGSSPDISFIQRYELKIKKRRLEKKLE